MGNDRLSLLGEGDAIVVKRGRAVLSKVSLKATGRISSSGWNKVNKTGKSEYCGCKNDDVCALTSKRTLCNAKIFEIGIVTEI